MLFRIQVLDPEFDKADPDPTKIGKLQQHKMVNSSIIKEIFLLYVHMIMVGFSGEKNLSDFPKFLVAFMATRIRAD